VRSQREKQWKLSTQTCPRMSKVAHGRVLVSQNCAESYRGQSFFMLSRLGRRGQSLWSLVLRGQSVVLIVVVSRRGQSFFMLSRYFACEMRDRYDDVMKVFWKSR